ncbi:hypothetical protein GF371_01735 [Candidatus Woesearchaeota archaeon]|nr:hypothetical protein [Candidatus Woesearchaeota archaeon]
MKDSLIELITAPKTYPEMIWMVIPLVIVTFVMTFYFGMYKKEQLGWNTAVGNSLVLIFVSIDLLRHIFNLTLPGSVLNFGEVPFKTVVACLIFVEGIALMFINMMHFLPKRISFAISAPLPINITAYIVMTIVYTEMVFDWITLLAAVIFFVILYLILKMVQTGERILLRKIAKARIEEEKAEIATTKETLAKQKKEIALKEKVMRKEEELEKLAKAKLKSENKKHKKKAPAKKKSNKQKSSKNSGKKKSKTKKSKKKKS